MATQHFYIVSKRSGKVLHVLNGSLLDNADIVQHAKSGGDNQRWALEPEISEVLKKETTNTLDINGNVLTSTVNGVATTIDLGSISADLDQKITDLEQKYQKITDLEQRMAALEKRLNNGKYFLKADTGNYLARCNNCVPGASLPDSAFVHVKEAEVMNSPWAQWEIILIP